MGYYSFWFILFLITSNTNLAQSSFTPKLLKVLDSMATQDVPPKAPGIATAIIQDGIVRYKKYAGLADLNDSSWIGPKTRFNIASNAKQFTALAILLLEDEKKLALSDDVRRFFPNLLPAITKPITLTHLLNHTSGLRDVYDLWALQGITWWKNSFGNKDLLSLILQQRDLNFEPGTQYLYSNTNYMLLALVVEKVSGRTFSQFTRDMFKRLNMPNTAFEGNHTKIEGPIARPYFNFSTWTTTDWLWDICGDGNLFSTLEDQIQWELVVQGKGSTTIKRRLIERSQLPLPGSQHTNYGYGLEFGTYKGLPYRFHEGATGAWKATVVRFSSPNLSVVTLTNTGKSIPYMQTRQMVDALLQLPKESTVFATRPKEVGTFHSEDEVVGNYLTESDFLFQFYKKDGKIYLKRSGRNDIRLEREAANIFRQSNDTLFRQEFRRDNQGARLVTVYYHTHAPYSLKKVEEQWAGYDFTSVEGRYKNEETGVVLEVAHTDGTEYRIKIGTDEARSGLLAAKGKLLVDNYRLQFNQIQGKVPYLLLSGDRIRMVRFIRVM